MCHNSTKKIMIQKITQNNWNLWTLNLIMRAKKIVNQSSDFPVRRTGSYRHKKALVSSKRNGQDSNPRPFESQVQVAKAWVELATSRKGAYKNYWPCWHWVWLWRRTMHHRVNNYAMLLWVPENFYVFLSVFLHHGIAHRRRSLLTLDCFVADCTDWRLSAEFSVLAPNSETV